MIFLIIIIILIFILNFSYTNLVIKNKLQYRTNIDYESQFKYNKDINYIIIGDSHAHQSINPKYLEESYNLGFSANSYIPNFYKLNNLIYNNHVKVKYLIIEIDPTSFSNGLNNTNAIREDLWYYSKIMDLNQLSILLKEKKIKLWILTKFPFIGNGKDFFFQKKSETYKGFLKYDKQFDDMNKTYISNIRVNQLFPPNSKMDELSIEYYKNILKLAQDNNISVILIKYPHTLEFNQQILSHNISLDEYYNQINKITKENIKEFYLLDYYNYSLDSTLFADSDHLNYKGAEAFTNILKEDLIKNGLT